MADLVIRNFDDSTLRSLRAYCAMNATSVRDVVKEAVMGFMKEGESDVVLKSRSLGPSTYALEKRKVRNVRKHPEAESVTVVGHNPSPSVIESLKESGLVTQGFGPPEPNFGPEDGPEYFEPDMPEPPPEKVTFDDFGDATIRVKCPECNKLMRPTEGDAMVCPSKVPHRFTLGELRKKGLI